MRTAYSVVGCECIIIDTISHCRLNKNIKEQIFPLTHREYCVTVWYPHQSYTRTDQNIYWTIQYNILTFQLTCKFPGKCPSYQLAACFGKFFRIDYRRAIRVYGWMFSLKNYNCAAYWILLLLPNQIFPEWICTCSNGRSRRRSPIICLRFDRWYGQIPGPVTLT